ncbi:MAG: sulfurtransferase complex subunit TusD [Colwellia sp.]|nr:sulfurtransferase complex subunit TusD [Colwellia sp.]
MNKLAVMITTPPYSNLSVTALDYIETALKNGVELIGVFFYQDGVLHADAHVQIASDEFQAISHWRKLHQAYKLPLYLCITAAEKRGISDEQTQNISPIFTISGLGELVELSTMADRLVQF